MSNYYKTISIGSTEIHAGCINQNGGALLLALNGSSVVEVKDNNAYINSKRILKIKLCFSQWICDTGRLNNN